jgi:hypothetical protein
VSSGCDSLHVVKREKSTYISKLYYQRISLSYIGLLHLSICILVAHSGKEYVCVVRLHDAIESETKLAKVRGCVCVCVCCVLL